MSRPRTRAHVGTGEPSPQPSPRGRGSLKAIAPHYPHWVRQPCFAAPTLSRSPPAEHSRRAALGPTHTVSLQGIGSPSMEPIPLLLNGLPVFVVKK